MSRPTLQRDHSPTTVPAPRRRRRRRRWALGLAAVLLGGAGGVAVVQLRDPDAHRAYLSSDGWPRHGQGAYQLGDGTPRASEHQRPVPIASLAKVMTAMVVLTARPLHGEGTNSGPDLVVTRADVDDYRSRRAQDQSVIAVRAGERLSERAALTALLLPSANNVAVLLARFTSGTVDRFVASMNATAVALGMRDTHYTDPSGFAWTTVSTANDQLVLARAAARRPVLVELMGLRSARLPVAGTVRNTDTLLGTDGFVGMKTGSDDAAGGCFMFRSQRLVRDRRVELIGVVLGQQGDNLVRAGLYSARQLADRVAPLAATI